MALNTTDHTLNEERGSLGIDLGESLEVSELLNEGNKMLTFTLTRTLIFLPQMVARDKKGERLRKMKVGHHPGVEVQGMLVGGGVEEDLVTTAREDRPLHGHPHSPYPMLMVFYPKYRRPSP
jgi:hypothetical protein